MSNTINSFHGFYRFLSNFWMAPCTYDGVVYPSSEHAYQAAKTLIPWEREAIRTAASPGQAKRLGRRITLRPGWSDLKDQAMYECVCSKFQDSNLATDLLNTGDAHLIEDNTWGDTYWGVCRGQGRNMLGKILMNVRQQLQDMN